MAIEFTTGDAMTRADSAGEVICDYNLSLEPIMVKAEAEADRQMNG